MPLALHAIPADAVEVTWGLWERGWDGKWQIGRQAQACGQVHTHLLGGWTDPDCLQVGITSQSDISSLQVQDSC